MRIAICEYDTGYQRYLIRLLNQIKYAEPSTIVSYKDADWLLSDLASNTEVFDIAIVHHEWQPYGGIAVARELKKANSN